jgi:hypothetical protein
MLWQCLAKCNGHKGMLAYLSVAGQKYVGNISALCNHRQTRTLSGWFLLYITTFVQLTVNCLMVRIFNNQCIFYFSKTNLCYSIFHSKKNLFSPVFELYFHIFFVPCNSLSKAFTCPTSYLK